MSVSTAEPQPPSEGPRNAKAEAKATKAYAKAMRPWYKKKRVIIPAGFVALVVAVSAGSSSNTGSDSVSTGTTTTASENTSQASQSDMPAAKEKPAPHKPEMTSGQENALRSAESYVDMSGFSKEGLIEQLSSAAGEGFTPAQALHAVNEVY